MKTCTTDECVNAPRCSSGATVWHDLTPECGSQSERLDTTDTAPRTIARVTQQGYEAEKHRGDVYLDALIEVRNLIDDIALYRRVSNIITGAVDKAHNHSTS